MPSPVMRIAPKPSRFTVKSPPKLNVGFVAIFEDVAVSAPRITSDLPATSAAPLAKLIPRNLRRVTLAFWSQSEALSCICAGTVRPRKSLSTQASHASRQKRRLERTTCSCSSLANRFLSCEGGFIRWVVGEHGHTAGQHRTAAAILVRALGYQMPLGDFFRQLQCRFGAWQ